MDKLESDGPSLFKYREFGNQNHLRFLENREVYFAPPVMFDDPKDCAVEVRTGPSPDEEFVAAWRENLIEAHPGISEEEVEQATRQFISADEPIPDDTIREHISSQVGVLSLARNPGSPRMWSDYAQSHTGFCVELNWKELNTWCAQQSDGIVTLAPLPVQYPQERPAFNLSEDSPEKVAEKAVTSKRPRYSWEEEYRVVGYGAPNEVIQIPDRVFESIAVGKGASRTNLRTVKEAAEGLDSEVRILKAESIRTDVVTFREVARI